MRQQLIVNADDYGHTLGVSEGIRRAHLQGIVTSTTAMMNRPAALTELPKAAALCPNLGLGVHLVLTTGVPVLSTAKVPGLVDAEGRFHRRNALIARLDRIDPDQVDAEWRAQVELFIKSVGRKPDHLDSHHHSSYFSPALFERMLRLAEELGCPIRNPFNDVSAPAGDNLPGGQPAADLAVVRGLLHTYRPASPQHFFSSFYDNMATASHLRALLEQAAAAASSETWELMCHPAVVDEELRAVSDYSDLRGSELTLLTNPALDGLLKSLDIKLVTFQVL